MKATSQAPDQIAREKERQGEELSEAARALSRMGASKGGKARAESLAPEQRSEQARKAVQARWSRAKRLKEIEERSIEVVIEAMTETLSDEDALPLSDGLPVAKYKGFLALMDLELPCYVLDDGQRVIGRIAATEMLTGIKGGGALEKYIGVTALKPFINIDLVNERMVAFRLPEVEGMKKAVKGLPADLLIDICRGFVAALEASNNPEPGHPTMTQRQKEMAIKAGMFLAACAKVGLDALIDEATGYQYERAEDALEVKLRAYIAEEMRKWEKTFPDELWIEFGRLTNWKGSVTQRPKYWGRLVMELVYEYLDPDVALWLKENAPAPKKGQNYHQWLSSQYGLKKLIEHIYKLIGISNTCKDIKELKQKMNEIFGKGTLQYMLHFPTNGRN
jgi:P63C domain